MSLTEEYVEARRDDRDNVLVPLTKCPVLVQPEGIVSFTHSSINNTKNIILLGDYHENKPFVHNKIKGQFVLDWIIFTLFENPKLHIDLFLESEYKKENPPLPGHGPLFENVYKHLLFIKKIPNLHVHDIDILLHNMPTFNPPMFKMIKQKIKMRFITPMLLAAFMCNVFKVTLRDIVPKQGVIWKKMYHKLKFLKKVKNEILVKNKIHYETANNLFCEQLEKSGTNKTYFLKCLYAASINSNSYFIGVSLSAEELLVFLNMSLMDAYCLASLLHSHDHDHISIVYAGETHINVYRSFFKRFYKHKSLEKQHAFDFINRRPQLKEPVDLTELINK